MREMALTVKQGIIDLLSLIGDHFFHDRELIAITSEKDRDLFNFSSLNHDPFFISVWLGHQLLSNVCGWVFVPFSL